MRSTMLALVAALLVAAGPAFAGGGESGDVELGVYGGYGWLDDYGFFFPQNNMLYGGRIGFFFTPNWSLEFSAQQLPTETEFEMLGVEDTDVELGALRLNLLYNFLNAGDMWRPFLTAGAGYEKTDIDGYGESCDWGWNAGGGLRWFLTPRWQLRGDGRYVSTNVGGEEEDAFEETQNNIEATLGLSYLFGGRAEQAAVAEPVNQPPMVTCASERAEILPGERVTLRATASDPEGDPLTYEWTTSAGRVTGMGTTASLDFTGLTAPATATVTVRVADSRGNSTSSDCSVRLLEPVRAAEAISCLAGGFPRNLSRLTNVDKACLDDVAQRLRADPRARVVVVGHADSRERSPEQIGEQRARAVRDYLVEAGIETSRITIRSSGATKPLDTGTDTSAQASNRRAEVWFVPEGATVPE
jgi:outer membrane protein OmpA-like peptidoglycan-associated protein/opacity protein-like surface antigen